MLKITSATLAALLLSTSLCMAQAQVVDGPSDYAKCYVPTTEDTQCEYRLNNRPSRLAADAVSY